ncbi:DUF2147 domain-containing protein [Sphingomonas sp. Y38-1Y]|uniref:DUF2147 domain-containing protein n=1 Tax=Sphingomonas sp. Y38-1Y TaxID=3078265 RepID=UPI0028E22D36|nr:DUF2147 domain-containing protein [Sphingomonas sp. Y38-1Y]
MRIGSVLAAMAALAAPLPASAQVVGLWMNPHGSVAVRTGPCGDKLCGWVAWASAEAQSDAREGGGGPLIGTELLQDYRPNGGGSWSGTVFVPDMNRRFSSRIDTVAPDKLRVKGCILGGLICKSQMWTRIEKLPA